ncbi:MAG: SDR family oxidoreductase [Verrucomicrobiota bacterium]|jgi:nucleoside-diphosphate-sugar epimerase|nr:SDR family oxidoreductase [Verrucomicrobiota bacterium]
MKTCLVIGAKGFIGSAVTAEATARGYAVLAVDLDTYEAAKGAHVDLLVNASGNSFKFVDAQDPMKGFDLSVHSVLNILHDFSYSFFIQLSSGAVYPHEGDTQQNGESTALDPPQMTHYGFHKWMAELLVQHYAPEHLILRMGGFVGPGLRKNAVYDLLCGGGLFVHPDSRFQYMDTRELASAVFTLYEGARKNATLLNISSRGTVSLREVAEWAGVGIPPDADVLHRVHAEINVEKIGTLLELPQTLDTIQRFLRELRHGEIALA